MPIDSISINTRQGSLEISLGQVLYIQAPFAHGKTRLVESDIALSGLRSLDLAASIQNSISFDPNLYSFNSKPLPEIYLVNRRGKINARTLCAALNLEADLIKCLHAQLIYVCPVCNEKSKYIPQVEKQLEFLIEEFASELVTINFAIDKDFLDLFLKSGFSRILFNSQLQEYSQNLLENLADQKIEVSIDRLRITKENHSRIEQAITQAKQISTGQIVIRPLKQLERSYFVDQDLACHSCGHSDSLLHYLQTRISDAGEKTRGWFVDAEHLDRILIKPFRQLLKDLAAKSQMLIDTIQLFIDVGLGARALGSLTRVLSPQEKQRLRLMQLIKDAPSYSIILLPDFFLNYPVSESARIAQVLKILSNLSNAILITGVENLNLDGDLKLLELKPLKVESASANITPQSLQTIKSDLLIFRSIEDGYALKQLNDFCIDVKNNPAIPRNFIFDSTPEGGRRICDLTGSSEQLSNFFAALEESRLRGFVARSFANPPKHSKFTCRVCFGEGYFRKSVPPTGQYIPVRCQECLGSGASDALNQVLYNRYTFHQIIEFSLANLIQNFSAVIRKRVALEVANELGLGDLPSNLPLWCLRPSERTALNLAVALSKTAENATSIATTDFTSHLSTVSLACVLSALPKFLGTRNLYIYSADQRLTACAIQAESACRSGVLNVTIC